MLRRRLSFI